LFLNHIQDRPILYNNEAYADFITEYYSNYFPFQIRYNRNVFVNQINRAENLTAIMDSLGRDSTLQNEQLREFVFLLGLRELYRSPEFSNSSILRLLLDIQSTTKFPEHAQLVDFIIRNLQRFESGINKANFRFFNPVSGLPYDFSESSKHKYVLFVNSLCISCDAEINIMRGMAENLNHVVDFYVVSCDYEVNRALRNMPRNLQHITYLHFNRDFETLESLGIVDFPIAVWLDPENIIQSYYFQLPSRRAERAIRQLTSQ
jgi:thiol-disulfide isomerase/thioredoxin